MTQARLLPHAALTAILFDRLRFVPDPKISGQMQREDFMSPEELSYLRLLERDLQKWIEANGISQRTGRLCDRCDQSIAVLVVCGRVLGATARV